MWFNSMQQNNCWDFTCVLAKLYFGDNNKRRVKYPVWNFLKSFNTIQIIPIYIPDNVGCMHLLSLSIIHLHFKNEINS